MLARWIPEHFRRMLRLLPGQFPADTASAIPENWLRIIQTFANTGFGDAITNTNASGRTFTIAGDQTARYPIGFTAELGGSSQEVRAFDGINDGMYTVEKTTLTGGGDTAILMEESIPTGGPLADMGFLRGNDTHTLATSGFQEIEEHAIRLRDELRLGVATGAALDVFGEILGLNRTFADDEEYRDDLFLQAAVNNSHGLPEELLSAVAQLNNIVGVQFRNQPPAAFRITFSGILPLAARRERICSMAAGGVACELAISSSALPFKLGQRLATGLLTAPTAPAGGFGHAYAITGVTPGVGGDFIVANDVTSALLDGETFTVENSTNNNGTFTIVSTAFAAGFTTITVGAAETVGAVADGSIRYGRAATAGRLGHVFRP